MAEGFEPIARRLAGAGGGPGRAHPGAAAATRTHAGVFEGIDASGALLLNEGRPDVRAIAAGEVFFG